MNLPTIIVLIVVIILFVGAWRRVKGKSGGCSCG